VYKNLKKIIVPILIVFIVIFLFQCKNNDFNFTIKNSLNLSADTDFTSGKISENIDRDNMAAFIRKTLSKALTQSDTYATCDIAAGYYGDFIRITDFDFLISDDATLEGIEVIVDNFSETDLPMPIIIDDFSKTNLPIPAALYEVQYSSVRLVFFESICSIEKSDDSNIGESDSDFYYSFGGPSDTWDSELTIDDVKDSTFGVQISYFNRDILPRQISVDHVQIKIYYSISEEGEEEKNPPTFDTITESADPLEIGATETININVYDDSIILFVYIEINDVNYSMSFISGDTYSYSEWTPISIGVKIYQIHMIDECGNINQTTDLNITVIRTINIADTIVNISWIFSTIGFMFVLMVLTLYFYLKIKSFLPILIVFLFSIVIGTSSLGGAFIPFTPWFQIFFVLFQTIFFALKALSYYNDKRGY